MPRHLGDDWVYPALDDKNRPFFTAGSLQFQACDDCGAFQQPPDDLCHACQSTNLSFRECGGDGTVESAVSSTRPCTPR